MESEMTVVGNCSSSAFFTVWDSRAAPEAMASSEVASTGCVQVGVQQRAGDGVAGDDQHLRPFAFHRAPHLPRFEPRFEHHGIAGPQRGEGGHHGRGVNQRRQDHPDAGVTLRAGAGLLEFVGDGFAGVEVDAAAQAPATCPPDATSRPWACRWCRRCTS